MKTLLIIKLLLLTILLQTKSDFIEFTNFVGRHFTPPESVKRNCSWQYAIVKVQINNDDVITDYHIENKVSTELNNSFKYLVGYNFKNHVSYKKHDVVFFISLESKRTDACDIPPTNTHERADVVFKRYIELHQKERKKNVYIDQIVYSLIEDPMK